MEKMLSLVIPTNGVVEWVIPVLESIYNQKVSEKLFEVIVMDNGTDNALSVVIQGYKKTHSNFIYKKSTSKLFMNQIDAFKIANGKYIKFVNHRNLMIEGSINSLIDFVKNNENKRPITFFLNNSYIPKKKEVFYSNFDRFAYQISYFSSWSGGVGCWKNDRDEIINNLNIYSDSLFPHLIFVYFYKEDRQYCVWKKRLFIEIEDAPIKKGNYDIFYAFGVEYVFYVKNLLYNNLIDEITYNHIISENEQFIVNIFYNYCLLRKKCSYNLSTRKKNLNEFYCYSRIRKLAIKKFLCKFKSIFK